MGRPKKYTDKYIRREAVLLLQYARTTPIPFLKDFCSKRKYSSQKMSEFAQKSEIFQEALKRTKDIQEVKIVKAAMVKKIDVTMAIFTLKNVAGWRDKQIEINNNTKNIYQNVKVIIDDKSRISPPSSARSRIPG